MDNLIRTTLTLKDVVETLAGFDFRRVPDIWDGKDELDGRVNPHNRIIEVSLNTLAPELRYTIIHELVHANHINHGYNSPEKLTERITNRVYETLYGHKFLDKLK